MMPPPEWFRFACEVIPHGLACVDLDNKFVWVNAEYSYLTGWSQSELVGRTWMSITADDDVGGDLRSVDNLKAENESRQSYTLHKRYKHRDGHLVPINLFVHSFNEAGAIKLFVACASATVSTAEFVLKLEREIRSEVATLHEQLAEIQAEREFKTKVITVVKTYWPLIAGIVTLAATAIFNIARLK